MKLLTAEELAKICYNTLAQRFIHYAARDWDALPLAAQQEKTDCMQAALDALFADIGEGLPSVEDVARVLEAGQSVCIHDDAVAVRNLWLTAITKHLAPVRALPEKWRKEGVFGRELFSRKLESALASLPLPTVEPAPEPQPSTFVHDGKTWIKHKPGDPCPVDGEAYVWVFYAYSSISKFPVKANQLNWGETGKYNIIGYRLADTPAQPQPIDAWSPPAGLVLHNPHGLTREQVGPEHRLLCTVEVDGRFSQGANGAQMFHKTFQRWYPTGDALGRSTYRVPITTPWPEVPKKSDIERGAEHGELRDRAEKAEARVKDLEVELTLAHQESSARAATWQERWDAELERRNTKETAYETRIAQLTPRPVTVKPTLEDGDTSAEVIYWDADGDVFRCMWNKLPCIAVCWLPGNSAAYGIQPETPEDEEFEAWWETLEHNDKHKAVAREAWQARAGKEGA